MSQIRETALDCLKFVFMCAIIALACVDFEMWSV